MDCNGIVYLSVARNADRLSDGDTVAEVAFLFFSEMELQDWGLMINNCADESWMDHGSVRLDSNLRPDS